MSVILFTSLTLWYNLDSLYYNKIKVTESTAPLFDIQVYMMHPDTTILKIVC
jgi:hypothetical protein